MADFQKLNELDDYTVASGDPDPRGWQVTSSDGRDIGRVRDLVVDTAAMKARYLDVEVDRGLDPAGGERHLLVPTEAVRIGDREREQKRITLDVTPESAARAAQRDAGITEAAQTARDWPSAGPAACNVRLTRGGHNG